MGVAGSVSCSVGVFLYAQHKSKTQNAAPIGKDTEDCRVPWQSLLVRRQCAMLRGLDHVRKQVSVSLASLALGSDIPYT